MRNQRYPFKPQQITQLFKVLNLPARKQASGIKRQLGLPASSLIVEDYGVPYGQGCKVTCDAFEVVAGPAMDGDDCVASTASDSVEQPRRVGR